MTLASQTDRISLARRLIRYDSQPALAFGRLGGQIYLVMYLADAPDGDFLYLALPLSQAARRDYLSGHLDLCETFETRQGEAYLCHYEHRDHCYQILQVLERESLDKYLSESEE